MAISSVELQIGPEDGWVKIADAPNWIQIRAADSRQWQLALVAADATPSSESARASGTITFTDQPLALGTVTVADEVFTFVAAAPTGNEILIGVDAAATVANLLLALSLNTNIIVSSPTPLVIAVQSAAVGTAGNTITLAESATNVTVSGAGTLTGGADATPYLTFVPTYQSDGWGFRSEVAIAGDLFVRTNVTGAQGQKMIISAIKDEGA